ncbi:MAG: hypothetical protein E7507_07255 [Ruminococcus sp.]|nr:hypothetical protein [Ruminococcus sp.]
MLFHTSDFYEEYKSSCFIELQFCRMPKSSDIKEIVSVDNIENRLDDSLYITDENLFYREYSRIFDCGIYNNLNTGVVDIYGINYYPPSEMDTIINRITENNPEDYSALIKWLEKARNFNGFYILGI